jgi:hypothetical protein
MVEFILLLSFAFQPRPTRLFLCLIAINCARVFQSMRRTSFATAVASTPLKAPPNSDQVFIEPIPLCPATALPLEKTFEKLVEFFLVVERG